MKKKSSIMIEPIVPSNERITRSTLLMYSDTLNMLYSILSDRSGAIDDQTKATRMRLIYQLDNTLKSLEQSSLSNTDIVRGKIRSIRQSLSPLKSKVSLASNNASLALIYDQIGTASISGESTSVLTQNELTFLMDDIAEALDPTFFADNQIKLRDALADYAFFELYRAADTQITTRLGEIGDKLLLVEKLLNSLSKVYSGVTFNPGVNNISMSVGEPGVDYTSADQQAQSDAFGALKGPVGGAGNPAWWSSFNTTVSLEMSDGIYALNQLIDNGSLDTSSQYYEYISRIVDAYENQFFSVNSYQNAAEMWRSTNFKKDIENATSILSDDNENLQLQVTKTLVSYNTWTQTASMVSKRLDESFKSIAKQIKS
ncbi:hypothetical protein N9N03_00920 [Chlamydiia bacterium]|nr:hypothetical protein [Chlamydiia bacterium]